MLWEFPGEYWGRGGGVGMKGYGFPWMKAQYDYVILLPVCMYLLYNKVISKTCFP